MASAFGHALAAFAIGKSHTCKKQSWKFWILGIVCSILPDVDVISFTVGIPYMDLWGHRGITHSICFAFILALGVTVVFFKNDSKKILVFFYLFLATVSHGVLDAMTSGGEGVAFFAPFENNRYFLPWREIKVSPIGAAQFFSEWGLKVIKSELIWIGIPAVILIGTSLLVKKIMGNNSTKSIVK
ncbi:MAG: metal-dependent hydrolase [Flavobacteriales bacterium]|nr:metal-dependent hydrolase [Flavobacteriales bacterium]